MASVAVTAETFDREVLQSEQPVIVDFWAPWCGPCHAVAPALEQIARERRGAVKVVKVNIDEEPELAARFGVASIPTILLFKDGRPLEQAVGALRKPQLENALRLPTPPEAQASPSETHRPASKRTALVAAAVIGAILVAAALGVVLLASRSDSTSSAGSQPGAESEVPVEDEITFATAAWKTDFEKHSVPLGEISSGGPGKDGIPAVDAPKFVPVSEADFLEAREPVVQLELGGEARAYPLQILLWHEIVNDGLAGTPVAVTFCPLCNTTIVFDRRLDGRVLDFGTTGNLRNSDLVMYDRQTESWWQQFGGEAIVGELTGKELRQLPAAIVAWEEFRRAHPDGQVLSRETGFGRSYGQNPYPGYDSVDTPPFFEAANQDDDRLPPKERVVFLERGDEQVVVPFSALAENKEIELEVGGEELVVSWKPGTRSALDSGVVASSRDVGTALVRSAETGKLVVHDLPFWFAVAAFAPQAEIVRG